MRCAAHPTAAPLGSSFVITLPGSVYADRANNTGAKDLTLFMTVGEQPSAPVKSLGQVNTGTILLVRSYQTAVIALSYPRTDCALPISASLRCGVCCSQTLAVGAVAVLASGAAVQAGTWRVSAAVLFRTLISLEVPSSGRSLECVLCLRPCPVCACRHCAGFHHEGEGWSHAERLPRTGPGHDREPGSCRH